MSKVDPLLLCALYSKSFTFFKGFTLSSIFSCTFIFYPTLLHYSQQNICLNSSYLKANKYKTYSLDPTYPSNHPPTITPLNIKTFPTVVFIRVSIPHHPLISSSTHFTWASYHLYSPKLFLVRTLMTSTYQSSSSEPYSTFHNIYIGWSSHPPLTFLMTQFNIDSKKCAKQFTA